MNWKTSNSETRERIGLQFFAEEATESVENDGFEAGFEIDGDYQPDNDEPAEETVNEPADEPAEPQEGEPAEETPAEPAEPPQEAAEPTVPLVYNGQQMGLPKSAVDALAGVLGGDVIALLQKGMNYEHRGSREIGMLERYAQAGGYDSRAAYLDAMERQLGQHQIDMELARLQEQYPETPEDALRPIAERTVDDRNAAERAARERENAERARAEMLRAGEEKSRPWADMLKLHPEVDVSTLGKEFFDLVNAGVPPVAAYERMETERVKQEAAELREQLKATQKNTQNRQAAIGTMASETLDNDPFLAGFGNI